jgi:hypothetical protein
VGSCDAVNVHHNRFVDLERTDCRSTVANRIVSTVGLHGDQSRNERPQVHRRPFSQVAALDWIISEASKIRPVSSVIPINSIVWFQTSLARRASSMLRCMLRTLLSLFLQWYFMVFDGC